MDDEERPNFGEAVAEAFLFVMLPIVIIGGTFALKYNYAVEKAEQIRKAITTQQGYVIGTVEKVETWEEENFTHKEGNMTLTLEITDRTRVTFTDGRTKELLGMPKEAIPTDKEVAITWAQYNILLEVMDAHDFRERQKKGQDDEDASVP